MIEIYPPLPDEALDDFWLLANAMCHDYLKFPKRVCMRASALGSAVTHFEIAFATSFILSSVTILHRL